MFKYIKLTALLFVFGLFSGIPALHAEWIEDGIAVCTMSGVQDLPVVVSDGSGGAIIAWRDDRVINTDIYAQRIDADGNVLWPGTAMPVCTAPNSQSYPQIIQDGAGGAIIAWQDPRGGAVADIYIQRINGDGYIQWQAQGVPVCTGQTGVLIGRMIPDGDGGAIVSWHDFRNFRNYVFVQRINAAGAVQWTVNGVSVSTVWVHQQNPVLASDGAGGAIVVWEDMRNVAADIYGQRINAAGAVQWGADGIAVCNSGNVQRYPRIIPDGSGGAVIAWEDKRNTIDFDIFAQRIDGSGALQWAPGGVAVSATMYDQEDCRIVSLGSGDAMVAWVDYRGGGTSDIYAQKIDAGGVCQWTPNGIVVCGAAENQLSVQLVANGSGGVIVTWEDERSGAGSYDLYAQRIDADGSSGWTADGLAVCGAAADQLTPQLAADQWGGASFTWTDERGGLGDIYSQKIDAAGEIGTATLLQSYSTALSGSDIKIEWILSEAGEDIDFYILRASEPSMTFIEIASAGISGDGLSFSFTDTSCEPGTAYRYRVDVRDGSERKVLFETGQISTPAMALFLGQNRPNPFNPSTTINYYLPETCSVVLDVYDVKGAPVRRLVNGRRASGSYTAVWDGCDENGRRMGSGVYFYRLRAGKKVLSRKMILLR
jgi:hypothetical protein